MPVFKAAMKIARQNLGLILMYVGIVAIVLCLTIQNNAAPQDGAYCASSMTISFVDEDNSPLSQALAAHLSKIHTLNKCENDPVRLMEDLYYRESEYVLRIPAGFGADPEGNPLQVTEVPGSYAGFYLKGQIESYLRQIHLYRVAGFSQQEAVTLADEALSPNVTVLEQPSHSDFSLVVFFRFLPYGALAMLSLVIGNVLCSFMKTEIRKRTGASAITHRRTERELLLAVAVFGLSIFCVFVLMGTVICKEAFWTSSHLVFYLANLAMMILVSTSIAYLIAMVANSQDSLAGIINSVSLGMSFLCGVFVPLEFMGEGVRIVAQFLPYYWYERAIDMIAKSPVLSGGQSMALAGFLGIQAAFSVAFIALGAAIHKKRNS